jgi:hypothetical protein
VVINLPISWKKVKGGTQTEWIGYWLDVGRFELGISESRAAWASRWLTDKATEGRVRLGELREGLGRLQFIAGPLEFLRPFLGPLYAWSAAGPKFAQPKLPTLIVLILKFLAAELKEVRMTACEKRASHKGEAFRIDAKAEGDCVVIGGWRTLESDKALEAPWFSIALTRATAPWAFERGEPFRTIASLELMATLVGLMILMPETEARSESAATLTFTAGTDNQGNSYLLDRMMTTKYPLVVVLMELAHQMRLRRLVLRARWLPRLQNEEADALTNFDYRHFSKDKRIPVDLEKIGFKVLPMLFEAGEAYVKELEEARKSEKARSRLAVEEGKAQAGKKRRKVGDALRDRDPWD